MGALLGFSNGIDRLNTWLNKYVIWLILIATLVSAVNAVLDTGTQREKAVARHPRSLWGFAVWAFVA